LKQVMSSELPEIRGDKRAAAVVEGKEEVKPNPKDLEAPKAGAILLVRIAVSGDARDVKDPIFRSSPASIRLVVPVDEHKSKNYYPVGTFDAWGGGTVWPSKI